MKYYLQRSDLAEVSLFFYTMKLSSRGRLRDVKWNPSLGNGHLYGCVCGGGGGVGGVEGVEDI